VIALIAVYLVLGLMLTFAICSFWLAHEKHNEDVITSVRRKD